MALADLFGDIADAIRGKDGTTAEIAASTFPARILAIPTGIGGVFLESIEITTPPLKTNYVVGEVFDSSGVEISALFSNKVSLPIPTELLTFSPSGPLKIEDTGIDISFSWGAETATANQPISLWWSPRMTSNTTPAPYIVSADTEYIDSDKNVYYAFLAFDGLLNGGRGECWYSAKSSNRFIQLYFGGSVTISGLRMKPSFEYYGVFPKAITIQISNDEKRWTEISEDSGNDYNPANSSWREIMFSAPVSCRYCKILCGTAYNGIEQSIIAEIEFCGVAAEE